MLILLISSSKALILLLVILLYLLFFLPLVMLIVLIPWSLSSPCSSGTSSSLYVSIIVCIFFSLLHFACYYHLYNPRRWIIVRIEVENIFIIISSNQVFNMNCGCLTRHIKHDLIMCKSTIKRFRRVAQFPYIFTF